MNQYQQPVKRSTLHWTETKKLQGNAYAYRPRVGMLQEGGLTVQKCFSPMGRSNNSGRQPVSVDVVYDKAYVEAYIYETLIKLFPGIPYNELQKLVSGAIKLSKEKEKNGEK